MFNNFMDYEYKPYHKIFLHQRSNNAIYLGDVSSALDMDFIRNQPIKVVVTAAVGMDQVSYNKNEVKHIIYPLLDAKSQNITKFFNHFYDLIEKQIQSSNILVHCAAGISRSATLVISYFMKKNKWTFKKAVKFVRDIRPVVLPNLGFEKQLKQYQTMIIRQSHTSQFEKRNNIQSRQSRKYNNFSFKGQLLPNINNLGQTSWIKSKALDKNLNIKFELQRTKDFAQRPLEIRSRKSQHQKKLLKKKPIHLGNFGKDQIFAKLQSGRTKMLQRTNNLININLANDISDFNDNNFQYYQYTPSTSHNKKLSSLSHRSQKRSQQLKLRRNYSNNKTRKQSNLFEEMNKVIANKLQLNQRKFNTQKNLRTRGIYKLAQL